MPYRPRAWAVSLTISATLAVALATGEPFVTLLTVAATCALLCLPLGGLVVRLVLPGETAPLVRLALAAGIGYAAAPLLLTLAAARGWLGWYPAFSLLLLVSWLLMERGVVFGRSVDRAAPAASADTSMTRGVTPAGVLLAVMLLGVVAVIPLMTPLRETGRGEWTLFSYVDDFYHLALVQSLTLHIPLADWPNLSGTAPEFYPVAHHTMLAALSRFTGTPAFEMVVVHARVIGVLLTTLLAYAIGTTLTGSRWGGVVSAALQHLVLVPNIYDRNWLMIGRTAAMLPNFYQLHFYSLRYATHAISGDILTLTSMLACAIALQDDRVRVRSSMLSAAGVTAALLLLTRGQFALVLLPAVGVAQAFELARSRRPAALVPIVLTLLAAVAITLTVRTPDSRADLTITYGVFGQNVSHDGFLPTRVVELIAAWPKSIQPALAVTTLLLLRFIGLNVVIFLIWGWKRGVFRGRVGLYAGWLGLIAAVAWAGALFVEQRSIPGNIGINVLSAVRMPVLIAVVPPLLHLLRLAAPAVLRRMSARVAVCVALALATLVATRGAHAALFDQRPRAYLLTAADRQAYRWVLEHTPPDAIVAAHPDHRVNARGETFRSSSLLSAMTARPVYVQRVTDFTRVEGQRRIGILRRFFSASAGEACQVLATERFDYVLEWPAEPLANGPLPCLALELDGTPRVWRVTR